MECPDKIPPYQLVGKRVWVAGHNGMVGSATVRRLLREECEILTVARSDLDLMVLSREAFEQQISTDPAVAVKLLRL